MHDTYIQAIEKVPSYDEAALKTAIDALFQTLQVEKDLRPGMRVLLKPNLLGDYNTYFSVTTNPAVVAAVADWLSAHGITDVTVADSPGGSACRMPGFNFADFYENAGYSFLAQRGVRLNTDSGWRSVPAPKGCVLKDYNILNVIADADYIINTPKLKTHNKTVISFGVKNLFGCVPDIQKPAFHARYPRIADFANMLVELAMTVKPALTVIDAVEIMEHNGPVAGEKRQLGMLFAAKDVFSQDAFLAQLLGVDEEKTDLLRIARSKGLVRAAQVMSGTFKPDETVAPLKLPDIFTVNSLPEKVVSLLHMAADKAGELLFTQTPCINNKACARCLRCLHSCPAGAIADNGSSLEIDTKKCIHCLCCSEVCTHRAIRIKTEIKKRRKPT